LVGIICFPLSTTLLGKSGIFIVEASGTPINNWWPVDGANITGVQPFKASIDGQDISTYVMYWQVDNGQENLMADSNDGSPHKEASVDVTNWSWHGSGPYAIKFTAKDLSGNEIGSKTMNISLDQSNTTIQVKAAVDSSAPIIIATSTADLVMTQNSASTTSPNTGATSSPVVAAVTATTTPAQPALPVSPSTILVWWPTSGTVVQGVQPLKAVVQDTDISQYEMYWKVGNNMPVQMQNNYKDSPHKEVSIDFTNWTWNGSGPYLIDLIAKKGDTVIAQTQISLNTNNAPKKNSTNVAPATSTFVTAPVNLLTATPVSVVPPVVQAISLAGSTFYVDPNSNAARQASEWQSTRPQDAAQMQKIAGASAVKWFGDWNGGNIYNDVKSYVDAATKVGKTPVMVLYDVPGRDCGSYSAGGVSNSSAYATWIGSVQNAIRNRKAVVVLEPDSLAQMDCLSSGDQQARMDMLKSAVKTLKNNSGTSVYMDAGHPGWQSVSTMADRLNRAGVAAADGFALNVSNFTGLSENLQFGDQLSNALGGKHFVVDTSRNGLGSNGEWCNPAGRGLGKLPTTNTGDSHADAFLWLKAPGESDGNCNGGPNAGVWWPEYALGLAQRSAF